MFCVLCARVEREGEMFLLRVFCATRGETVVLSPEIVLATRAIQASVCI